MSQRKEFIPNYMNLVDAAYNREPKRIPLYEHIISVEIMEEVMGEKFGYLYHEGRAGKEKFFEKYVAFFKYMGYDTVSYEACITGILPGGGALSNQNDGCIKDMDDFNAYDWECIPRLYREAFYEDFEILREKMPEGMKAVGGVGNGVFECVQDLVGYQNLCYMKIDEPELYEMMFERIGMVMLTIWTEFMSHFEDVYCLLRFGDDLGFKSNLLLPEDEVKTLIMPHYKAIVELVHSYNKPFLLHSCGKIHSVMNDLIEHVGIDAKHSNEDQIALFGEWVDRYGDRIGNFGGIDLDHICGTNEPFIREKVRYVFDVSRGHGGFAVGTGNSVPNYANADSYKIMVDEVRRCRGEY